MHAALRIGGADVMASDGMSRGRPNSRASRCRSPCPTRRPPTVSSTRWPTAARCGCRSSKTFFSPRFGMVKDRFGVGWMLSSRLDRRHEYHVVAPRGSAPGDALPYMLLIMEPRGQRRERTEAEGRQLYQRMLDFSADLKSRGVLTASQSLKSDNEGVRVQVRDGKRTLLDGPFSESKEMVGGYFLLDVETRDEAVAIAGEVPAAEWATVEVREFGPCFI